MAQMVPIGAGHENDINYRYKMPKLLNKVEGRGNGIRTAIPNMVEIAKALCVHPRYPTKFFGIELGAQSKYQEETERAIVNGAHTAQDLAVILDKFISLFVQCPTCRLPEIKWIVKKNDIDVDCAACGFNGRLPTNHKLVGYILKHRSSSKEAKGAISVKDKRKLKQQQQQAQASAQSGSGGKDKGSAARSGAGAAGSDDAEDDDDWYTDTSSSAQEQRRQEELAEMRKQEEVANDAVQKLLQQTKAAAADGAAPMPPVTVLKVFVATKERQPHEIVSELKRLQLSRGFDDSAKIQILLEALVDPEDPKTVVKQFQQWSPVFAQLAGDSIAAKTLLDRVEEFVGVTCPALLPRTPMILQALEDALPADVVLEWAQSPPESSWLVRRDVALAVRKAAKVYTDWLAEQEDDEGDDEGDEEQAEEEAADEE